MKAVQYIDPFNFDPEENTDDDSCIAKVLGCYSSSFIEYNENANDGNQEDYCLSEIIYGFINEYFVEYNSLANIDDGTCLYSWQELSIQLQSDLNAIVTEDGISKEHVDAAYQAGVASVIIEVCEEIAIENIPLSLPGGWSIFGYTCIDSIDLMEGFTSISEYIVLVKDEVGSAYLPEYGFNSIGDLNFGNGYQIKMIEAVTTFQFCPTLIAP